MKNAPKTNPIEAAQSAVTVLLTEEAELGKDLAKAQHSANAAQKAFENAPRGTGAEDLDRLGDVAVRAEKLLKRAEKLHADKSAELAAAQAELTRLQAEADAKAQADSEAALQEESAAIEKMAVEFFLRTFVPAVDAHRAAVLAHNERFLARLQTKWSDGEGEGRELVVLQQATPELRERAERLAQERNLRRYMVRHDEEVKARAEIEKQAAQTKERLAAGRVIHSGGMDWRAVP